MTPPSALIIRGLCAGFPGAGRDVHPVLQALDLEVQAGELLAVLGPSGCGKTTLLRVLAGLLPATAGEVELNGRAVVGPGLRVPPERRNIGLVPQDASLFPHLDVAANVAFGLSRRRWRRPRAVAEKVTSLLDLVGIPELAHRMPAELSGGQAQRVALARALAPEPDLVLLDEPFSALDAALRVHLRTEVREVLGARNATALLVTHDQDEALSVADRVALLQGGTLMQVGTPAEVYSRPATAWVAHFVGTCSLLPATVGQTTASCALGTVPATRALAVTTGQTARVVVRPEQLSLAPAGGAGVAATVCATTFLGHATHYRLRLLTTGDELVLSESAPVRYQPGDTVTVATRGALHLVP